MGPLPGVVLHLVAAPEYADEDLWQYDRNNRPCGPVCPLVAREHDESALAEI